MKELRTNTRELSHFDVHLILAYWYTADEFYLRTLGADINKLPPKKVMEDMLLKQLKSEYSVKSSYAIIWELDDIPIGHCNVNQINFGKSAFMHLHLWDDEHREKGIGTKLVLQSLPYFFENLNLKVLYCEPSALNPAPNKTLQKVGFDFEMKHITTPGSINFEQEVNRWKLTKAQYEALYRP
jgi:[ribosomal protein S5]-alanine N-acetyltransferase